MINGTGKANAAQVPSIMAKEEATQAAKQTEKEAEETRVADEKRLAQTGKVADAGRREKANAGEKAVLDGRAAAGPITLPAVAVTACLLHW